MDTSPECIKCPICFEVYPDKIYQCYKGHAICDLCYTKCKTATKKCPVCRVSFGYEPVRNLLAEAIMAELGLRKKVECPFKEVGCQRVMDSNLFEDHIAKCMYNFEKFGQLISICQLIDYKACSFQINRSNIFDWVEHLRKMHYANYREKSFPTANKERIQNVEVHTDDIYFHSPTIFNFKKEGFAILILTAEKKSLFISTYILNYAFDPLKVPKCEVKFTFTTATKAKGATDNEKINISTSPINILEIEDYRMPDFGCAIPISKLQKHKNGDEEDVTYTIVIGLEK